MTQEIVNLDAVCAAHAYQIVYQVAPSGELTEKSKNKLENAITKSLGVLQEQGVYAFFLFLDAMKNKGEYKLDKDTSIAAHIRQMMLTFLQQPEIQLLATGHDAYSALHDLAKDLDNLLLARELLEQTLIYARYHAKALGEKKDDQNATGGQ